MFDIQHCKLTLYSEIYFSLYLTLMIDHIILHKCFLSSFVVYCFTDILLKQISFIKHL